MREKTLFLKINWIASSPIFEFIAVIWKSSVGPKGNV